MAKPRTQRKSNIRVGRRKRAVWALERVKGIPDRMPVIRTKRQLASFEQLYNNVISINRASDRAKAINKLFKVLDAMPGRASRTELTRLLMDSNLRVNERLKAARLLEKQSKQRALSLYTRLLFVYDLPVTLRAHMAGALASFGVGVYVRVAKRVLKDPRQEKSVKKACLDALKRQGQ